MAVTPNLNLPLLDSEEKVSEDHLKINQFVEALDARLGEFATTVAGLATAGHSHEMAKITGLADALELLAAKDHSHKLDELADVDVKEAPDGKILQKIAGKWGLGERSYSVSEINSLFQTQKHPLSDIVGLEDLLAKFANTTKNTKFEKGISVTNGDLYLNNKSIIANDENGEFAERTGNNIDSIRHDDAANAWHFISDGRINERGNANLLARRVDLIDDNINLASSHQWLNRALCLSKHTHAIDENRSSSVSLFENRQYPPSNADAEKKFYKRGLFAIADEEAPAGSGLTYELKGVEGLARLKGGASVHAMIGGTSYSGTYEDSTGSVEYLYGHRAGSWVNGSGRVENLRGVYTSVNPNHDQAIIKNVLGTAIHMDYDGGTIETKPIGLHINFDGDWDGQERIGIAQDQVEANYLTGKTFIEGQEVLHAGNLLEQAVATGISKGLYDATLSHEVSAGVKGGSSTTSWSTRTLNTKSDPSGYVALSNNAFTPNVDMDIWGWAQIYASERGLARIYNVTDKKVLKYGSSVRSDTTDASTAECIIFARLKAGKTYRVEARVQVGFADRGFGNPTTLGPETYAFWGLKRR